MRHLWPALTTRLTDVVEPDPSARRMFMVSTRTIRGPLPLRYRVTRNRWIPVAVGPFERPAVEDHVRPCTLLGSGHRDARGLSG